MNHGTWELYCSECEDSLRNCGQNKQVETTVCVSSSVEEGYEDLDLGTLAGRYETQRRSLQHYVESNDG